LPSVPAGTRNLKDGVSQTACLRGDTTFTYLLKGSSTNEFYRFNTNSSLWQTMANAPLGVSGRTFKSGSSITSSGDGTTIYCLKGNYNEFYAYDVGTNTWFTLTSLPMTGSGGRRKAKDGAGIAWLSGKVYALKGGSTCEYWQYDVPTNAWSELTSIPTGTKRVKAGGALTAGHDVLFAMKGNNTLEFYKYTLPEADGLTPTAGCKNSLTGSPSSVLPFSLQIAPNPFSGATTISYSLSKAGPVSL
jgi:hypothetical protein